MGYGKVEGSTIVVCWLWIMGNEEVEGSLFFEI